MTRLHIAACGTSLWDNVGVDPQDLTVAEIHDDLNRAAGWFLLARDVFNGQQEPPGRFSAELATLTDGAPWAVDNDDRVALLASDTDDGLAAAMLVAKRLGDVGKASGITLQDGWIPDAAGGEAPAPVTVTDGPRPVTVVRVEGLDPTIDVAFNQAIARIAYTMLRLVCGHPPSCAEPLYDQIVLHLSGGYKATIPFLLVMAEAVASLFDSTVRAVLRFEPVRGGPPGPPIEVPVRRADLTLWAVVQDHDCGHERYGPLLQNPATRAALTLLMGALPPDRLA